MRNIFFSLLIWSMRSRFAISFFSTLKQGLLYTLGSISKSGVFLPVSVLQFTR